MHTGRPHHAHVVSKYFPKDECDVYLSIKFTGALYGGNEKDENAAYFDRMIVVRKK